MAHVAPLKATAARASVLTRWGAGRADFQLVLCSGPRDGREPQILHAGDHYETHGCSPVHLGGRRFCRTEGESIPAPYRTEIRDSYESLVGFGKATGRRRSCGFQQRHGDGAAVVQRMRSTQIKYKVVDVETIPRRSTTGQRFFSVCTSAATRRANKALCQCGWGDDRRDVAGFCGCGLGAHTFPRHPALKPH